MTRKIPNPKSSFARRSRLGIQAAGAHTGTHTRVHPFTHVRIHSFTYKHTHGHTHTCMHIHAHEHTHAHTLTLTFRGNLFSHPSKDLCLQLNHCMLENMIKQRNLNSVSSFLRDLETSLYQRKLIHTLRRALAGTANSPRTKAKTWEQKWIQTHALG